MEQLVEAELVSGYADLYRLSSDQVAELERMGDKSSKNVVINIQASKTRGLAKVLNALSIRHVGTQVAATIAKHFGSLDAIRKATLEELSEINEIGEVIAASLHRFVHQSPGSDILQELENAGVVMTEAMAEEEQISDVFAGKTFVVTGTLTDFTRDQIHELIVQHGGKTSSSVSGKTDYLVSGEKAGSKLAKAQDFGVEILSEADFQRLIAPDNLLF